MLQQIRTQHVSECGIDGPPEQETNRTRAHTHANDKWAQEGTRGPKGKVGGATARPAKADQSHGPHRLNFAMWYLPVACLSRFCRDELRTRGGSLL